MAAPSRPSIRVSKTFLFRGQNKVWSNRYFFTGPTPANSTQWTTLSDLVCNAEKLALHSSHVITGTEGYAAGSDVPVFSKTYTLTGTMTAAGGGKQQGEVAALVRYSTATRTAKNHPLYLFNYYHGVYNQSGTGMDLLDTTNRSTLQTYAAAWVTGFNDGTNVQVRCGPNGSPATGSSVDTYLTHRDFPRG